MKNKNIWRCRDSKPVHLYKIWVISERIGPFCLRVSLVGLDLDHLCKKRQKRGDKEATWYLAKKIGLDATSLNRVKGHFYTQI